MADCGPFHRKRRCRVNRTYSTIYDVRLANGQAGKHFFSADTLRFFSSRIGGSLYGWRYFITSERFDAQSPRLYTIREALPTGDIRTVGEFQAYKSSRAAIAQISLLLKAGAQ